MSEGETEQMVYEFKRTAYPRYWQLNKWATSYWFNKVGKRPRQEEIMWNFEDSLNHHHPDVNLQKGTG